MKKSERTRLLAYDRRKAFGQELADLCNRYRLRIGGTFTRVSIMEDGETLVLLVDEDGDLANAGELSPTWGKRHKDGDHRRVYEASVARGKWSRHEDEDDDAD